MAVKQDAADEAPYRRRILATLARAVDGVELRVLVEVFRDAQFRFQPVFRFLKGSCHHKSNVFVKAVLSTCDGRYRHQNSIVARSSIVVKFHEGFSTGAADLRLHLLNKDWFQRTSTMTTILAIVEAAFIRRVMHQCSPFYPQDKVIVRLVNVEDSKTVDLVDSGVLEDHDVDDVLPSGIRESPS